MAGSRASRLALFAVVLLGALAAASWQTGLVLGSDSPLAVTEVPSTLPDRGVQLEDGSIVLTPWTAAPGRAMSAAQAIAAANATSGHRTLPATALKVEVTTPNGWPMGSFGATAPSADHTRVWLVTYTSPKPIDASGGDLIPFYVTQFSEALNPVTGKAVFGFETPFVCRYAQSGSSLAACEHPHTIQWDSRQRLGDGNPKILRTETVRDLGGNPETIATLQGHFELSPPFARGACAALFRKPCDGAVTASYAWLEVDDLGYELVTSASQLAAISDAQHANPLFSIFPDFTFRGILCAIPIEDSFQTIDGVCRTTLLAPRTIEFQERWPVRVPAQTHPRTSGWIVSLDHNGDVRSIRQFGDLPPQVAAGP